MHDKRLDSKAEVKNTYIFLFGIPEGKRLLEDRNVNGRIILR
jgi:hypothetical protein